MNKSQARKKRKGKIRSKISGTAKRPRISVFRSLKYIYVQFIDDDSGKMLFSFDSRKLKKSRNNMETAAEAGEEIGKIAKAKKISEAVFDRGGYKFHGRVKALAEGMRKSGMKF